MHFDPIILQVVGATLVILGVAFAMRVLQQPHVVGYLLAGVLLGPFGFKFFQEYELVNRIGEFGVIFLLFFVGMETSPHRLLANWRITFVGTAAQILGSIFLMWLIGLWLDWPLQRVILLGFVISLSSTAVVLNYLRDTQQMKSKIGQDILGILLAQDLALIPMLIVVNVMAGGELHPATLALQGVGTVLTLALLIWLTVGKHVRLPLGERLRSDHELQVFFAFGVCLGLALLTGLFQLSTALGAFLGGMLIGVARETNWVHHRLEPFRVMFVAVFFVSIGMLVDVPFVVANWYLVLPLVGAVFFGNTLINATMLRLLGDPWRYSIYAGAYLAQIGEFSFLLAAVGVRGQMITAYTYQLTVAVIALSLFFSPSWIALVRATQNRAPPKLTAP